MKIILLSQDKYPEYGELTGQFGTVFNDLRWIRMFGDKAKIYTLSNNDGRIMGGFTTYQERICGVKFNKCPPFTPSNALFFVSAANNTSKVSSDQKSIISEIAIFYDKQLKGVVRVSFPVSISDFQPFIWKKFKVIPHYTYIHDLSKSFDEIFSSFSPEKRNEIKKTYADDIEVVAENDYKVILESTENTFKQNRIKFESRILHKILFDFADSKNSFAFVAKKENCIKAYSFCVYDKNTAYYLFGGHSGKNRHSGAGSATLLECIKNSKMLGLKNFDFEGSMNPQIEHFFRGFGASLTPYYTINKATLPLELVLKFIKREYF